MAVVNGSFVAGQRKRNVETTDAEIMSELRILRMSERMTEVSVIVGKRMAKVIYSNWYVSRISRKRKRVKWSWKRNE